MSDFFNALLAAKIAGGGDINEQLKAGTNIVIEPTADGKAKISASGEVSSEDTYAREEIQGILDGTTLDSFGDVETALADKVDKVSGKGLSSNDFTNEYKDKVDNSLSTTTAAETYQQKGDYATTSDISDMATETWVGQQGFLTSADEVPEVTSEDDGKVLKASYSGGTGTYSWQTGGGSGGTSDYTDLSNKPQINSVTLSGNKTSSDLGLQSTIDSSHKLSADLIDDTSSTNKFNVQADWEASSGVAEILHKPTLGTAAAAATTDFATATQGSKADTAIQGIKVNSSTVNPDSNKVVSITVPTSAADVHALADSVKYAGASTAGGSATSAAKLDTASAGSATQPVYFANGIPTATTYSLAKSVPADAVFTDTTYSEATTTTAGLMSAQDKTDLGTVQNNISITDITANFTAATGYTIQSGISSVYRQGKHVFGTLSIKIDSGYLPTTSTTVATNNTDKPNSATLLPCGCGVDEWRIDSIGTCYYSQYNGEIQCKDTVSTNTCFNLQLNYLTF